MFKSVVVIFGFFLALASAMPAADTDLEASLGNCSITTITGDIVAVVVKSLDFAVDVVKDSEELVNDITTCAEGQKWYAVIECIIESFSGESEAIEDIVASINDYVTYVKAAIPDIKKEINECKEKSLLDFSSEEEF